MHFCLAILAVAVSLGLGAVAAPMPADVAVVAAVSDLAVTKVVTDPLDVVEDVLDELDVHVSSILPMLGGRRYVEHQIRLLLTEGFIIRHRNYCREGCSVHGKSCARVRQCPVETQDPCPGGGQGRSQ